MKLFHHDKQLGEITNVTHEGVWMSGDLALNESADAYKDFFAFMTDESHGDEEPPFSEDLLNPEHWSIEDDDGIHRGIEVPAVYDDGTLDWRWR